MQDILANKPQTITVLPPPYTAHKTLGHYKEPAGTQVTQAQRLRDLCAKNTSFLWTCPLSRREAWTYYFACFFPSVCYPLSCSSMSKSVLESIQWKSLAIIIARCGFNRNTKREIIFGPLELGGANFRHLYHQQGLGQIKLFLTHWRSKTQAGKLLRIALQWFQQAVGTSTSILEDVNSLLPHLELKWIKSRVISWPQSTHPCILTNQGYLRYNAVTMCSSWSLSCNQSRIGRRKFGDSIIVVYTEGQQHSRTLRISLVIRLRNSLSQATSQQSIIRSEAHGFIMRNRGKQNGSYGDMLLACGALRKGDYIRFSASGYYPFILNVCPISLIGTKIRPMSGSPSGNISRCVNVSPITVMLGYQHLGMLSGIACQPRAPRWRSNMKVKSAGYKSPKVL